MLTEALALRPWRGSTQIEVLLENVAGLVTDPSAMKPVHPATSTLEVWSMN